MKERKKLVVLTIQWLPLVTTFDYRVGKQGADAAE